VKILTISGSLQARSSNTALVRAAQRVAPKGIDLVVYDSLGDVPLLNPDLDGEGDAAPAPVRKLRTAFAAADGILLASPEYGHSVPGLLKNALDWLVASGELSGMRVGLISASPTMGGGIGAQMALTRTLMAQAALVSVSLTVPGVKAKLDTEGELVDPSTLRRLQETLVALGEAAEERRAWMAQYQ
jgi:NAD(P)H-dependent FMN reductase